jgi:hypothetical protein
MIISTTPISPAVTPAVNLQKCMWKYPNKLLEEELFLQA